MQYNFPSIEIHGSRLFFLGCPRFHCPFGCFGTALLLQPDCPCPEAESGSPEAKSASPEAAAQLDNRKEDWSLTIKYGH